MSFRTSVLLLCHVLVHSAGARDQILKDLAEPLDAHDVLEASVEDTRVHDTEPEQVPEDLVDMASDVPPDVQ